MPIASRRCRLVSASSSRFSSFNRSRRLLTRYLLPHRLRMALLAGILCLTIGVQIVAPLIASRFIDRAVAGVALHELILLALLTLALTMVGQAAAIAETWVAENVGWSATNTLRADLLAHLLRLDASFHTAHTPGELIERVDGDVGTVARFFSRFVVYVLGNALLVLGVLILLILVDWRVGLGLSAFVLVALVAMLRIRAAATPYSAAAQQASADFYGFLGEYLSGLEDVRSSGAGAFVMRRCAEMMRAWRTAILRAEMRGYGLVATSQGLFGLGTAVAFAISAMLYRDGTLTIGTVYLIFRYTDLLRQPTEQIRTEVQDLQQADASLGRIEALLATMPALTDGPGQALPPGPLAVAWEDVSFGYGADDLVLRDIRVTVEPGRVLGVLGRTGSGKTTLTRLLPRFHDPSAGTVRIAGIDLREVTLAAVRSRIGLVTQDVHLFDASIRDNLTLFDDTIPDERIAAVLDELGLGAWRRELPDGLATRLASGGAALSAGQAQVLACARIFLRDPGIVILDEPSSRLDLATERQVHAAFNRLLAGRTGIIIAHRLATVADADDILILDDGRMGEYGARQALAADPTSRFATLLRTAGEGIA